MKPDPQSGQIGPDSQSGQLVVEYVLLLLVAVSIAFSIRTVLVKMGDSAEDSGAIIKQWNGMECAIAADDPNDQSANNPPPTHCP